MTIMSYIALLMMPAAALILAGGALYLTRHEREATPAKHRRK
ncbi:hypothetical protein [Afifella sp. IM 167]|nr:hypothetical protein [Afifella sp. IM 167]